MLLKNSFFIEYNNKFIAIFVLCMYNDSSRVMILYLFLPHNENYVVFLFSDYKPQLFDFPSMFCAACHNIYTGGFYTAVS